MDNQPSIIERAGQPYVAITRPVTMTTFHEVADRLPEVIGWLASQGIAPAGPPFFKYDVIDMERELIVEACVPVDAVPAAEGDILNGQLPAGRYVTLTHVGNPDQLIDVTRYLLEW